MLIMVSVAAVLITPDPNDDVDGTLQQRQIVKALYLISISFSPFSFPQTPIHLHLSTPSRSLPSNPITFVLCPALLARSRQFLLTLKPYLGGSYATVPCLCEAQSYFTLP